MNNELEERNHQTVFEQIKMTDEDGNEFWSARDLSRSGASCPAESVRTLVPTFTTTVWACEMTSCLTESIMAKN